MKRFLILVASLAVLLAACGGTTSDPGQGEAAAADQTQQESTSSTTSTSESPSDEPDPGEDGEWTLDDFVPGARAFNEDTDFRAIEMEAQQAIAECMAAEGFDYIPFVPSDVGGGFAFEEFDEEEYVKTYGFGISTWVLQEAEMYEDGEFEDPYADDPNLEIVDAMDEFELEEYYRALYGGEPDIIMNTPQEELEAMTEEELMAFYDEAYMNWVPDGCNNEVYNEMYGGSGADMAFWEEFGADFEDIYTRAESDPRIVDAQAQWSTCMAEKGHQYVDQEEMYAYFYGTEAANGQWVEGEFQQRVNELITIAEYVFEEPVEGEGEGDGTSEDYVYQPPEYDLEKLQPLIDEELAIATANYECEMPMRDLFETVYKEYEKLFIDENLDRLVAFSEDNG